MTENSEARIFAALDAFQIELPSWGFANTGTRFGKFIQPAAAVTIEDKFSDAGQVHTLTGACPTIALHVQWDLPNGLEQVPEIASLALKYGIIGKDHIWSYPKWRACFVNYLLALNPSW